MTVVAATLYRAGKVVGPVALDDMPECHGDDEFVWIGLYEPDEAELQTLAARYGLHPLAVEDAVKANQLPKVDIYGDQLFVVTRTAHLDGDHIRYGETAIFVGKHHVISVRHGSARAHTALRRTVEDLDPGARGDLMTRKKLFGILPFGNKMRDYFEGYQSAQSHIAAILKRLQSGKDELLMDNAAIDTERANLWTAMGRLEQMIHLSKAMDQRLEDKANELDHTDPAKAKAIRETALFYTRQRTQDLLTQMAVTVQGYLALDLVKKNNVELVKGVDRASTTTVSALRTAVTVAQALTNQKLVLEQITALNTTTAGLIDSTGKLLKSQTAQIHEQSASSTIPLETLQRAFQNIYDTMDAIDSFKLKALDSMKTTVTTLGQEVERSKGYIARAEGAAQNAGGGGQAFRLEAL